MARVLAASQQLLKCHGARDRSVIEEDGNRFSGWQAAEVGRGGIDRANLLGPLLLADLPPPRSLLRLENGEADPLLRQRFQGVDVDGGLGEPHPFRLAAEAMLEVAYSPTHLRALVACIGEGKDYV